MFDKDLMKFHKICYFTTKMYFKTKSCKYTKFTVVKTLQYCKSGHLNNKLKSYYFTMLNL